MLAYVSDLRDLFGKKLGGRREHAFEVTNLTTIEGGVLGREETPTQTQEQEGGGGDQEKMKGRASFDRAWFCGGMSTYGSPWVVSVVSVRGGWMNVCVTWEEGVVLEEEAVEMKGWLEGCLRELGGVRG